MKSILLPTDFSPNSINAINYATDMFKDVVCKFYLLNVQKASAFISDDFRTMSPSTTIYQSLIESTKDSLKKLVSKIETRKNPNHSFETVVDYDNFVDAINQMCVAKEIDLIVMGTKGATGAERVLFGSNTVRVMQRCSTPVLAIPQHCTFKGLDKIAFTSNYLTFYNKDELFPLIQMAELFNSEIEVLHMVEEEDLSQDQENNKAFVDACFKYVSHEFVDLEKSNLFDSVMGFIKEKDIKMLAIMSRKHSFLERLFTKHNVEIFGFKIDVPLLVMENTGKLYAAPT
ncbi:MAG: universal stress protein [Bacteroidia bacterium]|nr:universal stress protein [Bacteroidia bacterium]NND53234.1 universal stress protein [Flavobacteriaceae bacterium]